MATVTPTWGYPATCRPGRNSIAPPALIPFFTELVGRSDYPLPPLKGQDVRWPNERGSQSGCKREIALRSTIRNVTMPSPSWSAPPAAQPKRRSAVLGALLGTASMILAIVALTRPPANPTYSAAQRTAARTDLCDRFKPAMDAVHIETNGPDAGLRRIALVNGALILGAAASNPAMESTYRDAADALVQTYESLVVESSSGRAGDSRFNSAVDAVNTKERALKELCGD